MIEIIMIGVALAALFAHRPSERRRQLHLAEAPDARRVNYQGREYLVVSDGARTRVVSLAAVREEQPVWP